jgi:acetoacetyl-CoA synthetase
VWNHGDWAMITSRGGVVIYGRSDATLNRHGVRIGTSELYNIFSKHSQVEDLLIIHLQIKDLDKLFLFIKSEKQINDNHIKNFIRKNSSPRHVPDEIYNVPDIPYTISGKKVEVPVKRILNGEKIKDVVSVDVLRNPSSLMWFEEFAENFKSQQ